MMQQHIRFTMRLSSEQYLLHYSGVARHILVQASDGRRVQIPAHHFRRFVSHDGLNGEFEMTLDGNCRIIALRRVGG